MKTESQIKTHIDQIDAQLRIISKRKYPSEADHAQDAEEIQRLASKKASLRWVLSEND